MSSDNNIILSISRDERVSNKNAPRSRSFAPQCRKTEEIPQIKKSAVPCKGCSTILCSATGGKARLTEGCSFRRKPH
ncbi:hypothetical protein WA026_002631 [Henosepilachna vigintioctopunctata]|uniref:Uncharacterized protein n=1 Tax=Henosepilachna vigintioctopunctata TaxID=420089 RepID=A0AAW1TU12_9CUCU